MTTQRNRVRSLVSRLKHRWGLGQPWSVATGPAFLLSIEKLSGHWAGIPWRTFQSADFERDDAGDECITIAFDFAVVKIHRLGIEPMMAAIALLRLDKVWETPAARVLRLVRTPRIGEIEVQHRR